MRFRRRSRRPENKLHMQRNLSWDQEKYLGSEWRNPRLIHDALGYAAVGLRVIPLGTKSKNPWIERWPERASCEPDQIVRWFERWPNSNIGIATGRGYFTIDVDPRNGGEESLRRLCRRRKLPPTAHALTGSGGHHYLYRYDPTLWIGDRTGLLPGVDLKGEGGQFVVEPSVHPKTRREYTWLIKPEQGIADATPWLLAKLAELTGDRRVTEGDEGRLVLDRTGEAGCLVDDVVARFPVMATGQRNSVMSRVIASLLGRGFTSELSREVVMGWYDYYKLLGLIRTERREAERHAIANIARTLRLGRIRPAKSGIDHRDNVARLELGEYRKELILNAILLGADLYFPSLPQHCQYPPPPCKSMTSLTDDDVKLCKTPQEFAFVESLVAYLTDKIVNRRESRPLVIGEHLKQAILDRHQIRIDDQQLNRLKTKYVRREGKPATRFELVVQVVTGKPGVPSQFELTGVWPLMGETACRMMVPDAA